MSEEEQEASGYLGGLSDLIGKTILSAQLMRRPKFDDQAWLVIAFTDGSSTCIVGSYGGYSGKSEDEYPAYVGIATEMPSDLVPVDGSEEGER